jgi:hypothetical protein
MRQADLPRLPEAHERFKPDGLLAPLPGDLQQKHQSERYADSAGGCMTTEEYGTIWAGLYAAQIAFKVAVMHPYNDYDKERSSAALLKVDDALSTLEIVRQTEREAA